MYYFRQAETNRGNEASCSSEDRSRRNHQRLISANGTNKGTATIPPLFHFPFHLKRVFGFREALGGIFSLVSESSRRENAERQVGSCRRSK